MKIQRDYYTIAKAAELIGCSEDDLIHAGAQNRLDVWAKFDGEVTSLAGYVCQEDDESYFPGVQEGATIFFDDEGQRDINPSEMVRLTAESLHLLEVAPMPTQPDTVLLRKESEPRLIRYEGHGLARTSTENVQAHLFIMAEDVERLTPNEIKPKNLDRPLETRERRTLLVIIAALCEHAKLDPQGRGTAQRIREATENLGTPVDDETIRNALRETKDALENRMK